MLFTFTIFFCEPKKILYVTFGGKLLARVAVIQSQKYKECAIIAHDKKQ